MKQIKVLGALLACISGVAFAQFEGSFYYKITPRVAAPGDTVRFQAFEWNSCLYSYDVSYTLSPTPISSIRTTLVKIRASKRPTCATMMGYSGPVLDLSFNETGRYIIQFDELSDFKKDLGDTNYFEIKVSANIANAPLSRSPMEKIGPRHNAIGQRFINHGSAGIGFQAGNNPVKPGGHAE